MLQAISFIVYNIQAYSRVVNKTVVTVILFHIVATVCGQPLTYLTFLAMNIDVGQRVLECMLT